MLRWSMAVALRYLALAISSCTIVGCSSGDAFQVADDTGSAATDSATDSASDAGDGAVDAAPADPCADEAGKTKICLQIVTEGARPAYGTSAATSLAIDGKGQLQVFVFDKDPAVSTSDTPVLPVRVLRPTTDKIGLDKLPLTLTDVLPGPGSFWFIAAFADADRGPGDTASRAGDFVSAPLGFDKKGRATWQKLDVVTGKTGRDTLKIRALRRLDLTITAAETVVALAKSGTYVINGDGPAIVYIYDGLLGKDETVLAADFTACLELKPKAFPPPMVLAPMLTTVVGSHNIFVGQPDWQGCTDFPCRGTLMSATEAPLPTVDIKGDQWISTGNVRIVQAWDPYLTTDAPKTDTVRCK